MIQLAVMLIALLVTRPTPKRVVRQFRKVTTEDHLDKIRRKYPAIPSEKVTIEALQQEGSEVIQAALAFQKKFFIGAFVVWGVVALVWLVQVGHLASR